MEGVDIKRVWHAVREAAREVIWVVGLFSATLAMALAGEHALRLLFG